VIVAKAVVRAKPGATLVVAVVAARSQTHQKRSHLVRNPHEKNLHTRNLLKKSRQRKSLLKRNLPRKNLLKKSPLNHQWNVIQLSMFANSRELER